MWNDNKFVENPVLEVLFEGEKVPVWKNFQKIKIELVEYNSDKAYKSQGVKMTIFKFKDIWGEIALDSTKAIHIGENAFTDFVENISK
jgi:hypothetical protein